MKLGAIPLQIKLAFLLVLMVLAPLGMAAYILGDVGRTASDVARVEARSRIPVLQKSYATYDSMINTTKRLHTEIAGRLARRPEVIALDPELALAELVETLGIDANTELAKVLVEPEQAGLVAIAILAPDGRVVAEASRPLAGAEWRGKLVEEPLGERGSTLQLTFEVSATVNKDLDDLKNSIDAATLFVEMNRDELPGAYQLSFLALMAIAAAGAVFIGLLISTLITRRVSALVTTARRVSAGRHEARVGLRGHDEMAELGRAFDAMLDNLDAARHQVEYLQRMGVWQDVARRLAHEIKNPLTPIQLAVQQCVSAYKGDDVRFKKLLGDAKEIVEEEIEGLRRLVDTFRTLGALPKVEAAPIALASVIEELKLDPSMAPRVSLVPPPAPVTVRADKLLLKRVLSNLVENGIHAGQEAGNAGDVVISWRPERDVVRILIDDHGKGVRDADHERIFEPYVTTKATGTGLGLAIARKIAIEHGGDLAVASERAPTGGARFIVSLPLRGAESSLG